MSDRTVRREPLHLTERDFVSILQECEKQRAMGPRQIAGFAAAYAHAKGLIFEDSPRLAVRRWLEEEILGMARLIEPRNAQGYRKVPVTFSGGGTAIPWENVPRAMHSFVDLYARWMGEDPTVRICNPKEQVGFSLFTPQALYEEFQKIHPFEDGNGRVGMLLAAMATADAAGRWVEDCSFTFDGSPGTGLVVYV